MTSTKSVHFFRFIFGPLFQNGRWLIWALEFLFLIMMGNTITSIRMDIPNLEQVVRVGGKFFDTSKEYNKGVLFDIGIVSTSGVTYRCNCEPLRYSNCLGRKSSDHKEILNQLDAETVKKYTLHKAILQWLDGQEGELWIYPNRSIFGSTYSCYQISDKIRIHRSFEQSVQEYMELKSGADVYFLRLIALIASLIASVFIIVRFGLYLKERRNG